MTKYYPESKVEITGFEARHYDFLINAITLGKYNKFIQNAIASMRIKRGEKIVDFGAGTGKNACLMRQYLGDNGKIVGLDIGKEMEEQFRKNCRIYPNIEFKHQRIDINFDLGETFDRVLISFVLHGFPQNVRIQILQNAYHHLKPGGILSIVDYNEFHVNQMPFYLRIPFKKVECVYAFDFVERSWKDILSGLGFGQFPEQTWFKGYLRLLQAVKEA
jgi:demethylmenaquinone methyltransferase/2-methoxy-6-polyprenyl-1,4-benzoquinol methylase